MPWPSCSLFMVPQSSNTLKFSKKFLSAECCYLLQRIQGATQSSVLELHACGSVSTKLIIFKYLQCTQLELLEPLDMG